MTDILLFLLFIGAPVAWCVFWSIWNKFQSP